MNIDLPTSWLNWSNLFLFLAVIALLGFAYSSIIYVPNNRVGIKERLWSMKGSVKSGIMALQGEAGFEPEMLRGGFHLLFPFMYRVHKKDLVFVPQGEIGYVFARDGVPLPPGQTLGSNVTAGDFEDVRAFLAVGGNKGPQRKILREGVYAINTAQFVVLTAAEVYALGLAESDHAAIQAMHLLISERQGFRPLVIDSKTDVIAVVTAHDGPALPVGELIAPVVGQTQDGHSKHASFQEPDAFVTEGGYRGRQLQVLVDGTDICALDKTKLAIFRRRQIGLIYQFYNLIPILDVEENIPLPLLLDERKLDPAGFWVVSLSLRQSAFPLANGEGHRLQNSLGGGSDSMESFR